MTSLSHFIKFAFRKCQSSLKILLKPHCKRYIVRRRKCTARALHVHGSERQRGGEKGKRSLITPQFLFFCQRWRCLSRAAAPLSVAWEAYREAMHNTRRKRWSPAACLSALLKSRGDRAVPRAAHARRLRRQRRWRPGRCWVAWAQLSFCGSVMFCYALHSVFESQ